MSDMLKEFLVSLGFHVDETSFKKFNDGIASATKTTVELGVASIGTATAVGKAIVSISDHMEDLYYISQRTKSAVENIQGAQYGFGQIGLTAGDATHALESFASALRINPGNSALLNALGVNTKDKITGQARDTEEVFNDLIKTLKDKPFYLAKEYAAQFGIDEKTLLMLEQGYDKAIAAAEDFKKRQRAAGIDAGKLAEDSKDFGNELRHLESDFDILGERIEKDFLPIATKLVKWTEDGVEAFNKLDNATDGTAGKIGVAAVALGSFFGLKGALSFLGIGGKSAAVKEVEAVATAAELAGTKIGAARIAINGLLGLKLANDAVDGLNDRADLSPEERKKQDAEGQNSFGKRVFGWIPGLGNVDWSKPIGEDGGLFGGVDSKGSGSDSKIGDAIAYLRKLGWSGLQAAGLASNIERESGGNHKAEGDNGQAYGIGQWHAERQKAFKEWSGHDIRQSDLHEQLAFMTYELTQGAERRAGQLLSAATTPAQAGEIASRFYERPGDADGEAAIRARRASEIFKETGGNAPAGARAPVTISQSTTIHVDGAADAHGTANAVEAVQSRVNSDLVRNMDNATR